MAEEEKEAEAAEAEGEAPKKGSKKKLLIIVAAVNLVFIGGAIFAATSMTGAATGTVEEAEGTEGDEVTAAEGAEGEPEAEGAEEGAEAPAEEGGAEGGEAAADAPQAEPEEEDDSESQGSIFKLDSFVVNLADRDNPRYLKVDIAVELADEDATGLLEDYDARIRDTILAYLTGLTTEQTMGPLGKSDMRFALKERVNKALPKRVVRRVYFTQFIVH